MKTADNNYIRKYQQKEGIRSNNADDENKPYYYLLYNTQ